MTADDKYSLLIRDNLTQPIQMQLYQTPKAFSQFCFPLSRPTLNFEHLEEKDDPPTWCIADIMDSEKRG